MGIAGKGRGIVPSGSGVGLGVGESIGAGVRSDRTVSGVRSGTLARPASVNGHWSKLEIDRLAGRVRIRKQSRHTKRAEWL